MHQEQRSGPVVDFPARNAQPAVTNGAQPSAVANGREQGCLLSTILKISEAAQQRHLHRCDL
jgi:hypothetical protein